MKYELETIPVWDSLKHDSECFLCELMKAAEAQAVDYYLGESVMNPSTRVKVNRTGFCAHHWQLVKAAKKSQQLALIEHTWLQETIGTLAPLFGKLKTAKGGRQAAAAAAKVVGAIAGRDAGCLVCRLMEERLKRYGFTAIRLWKQDGEFRKTLLAGKGMCLHHLGILLKMAPEALSAADAAAFSREIAELADRNLQRLEREIWWMTQKYKAEFADAPWNGSEDAHMRLMKKITGEGRIVCPS